ncbi:exonuclease domain-containing protein [Clostridium aestuarii]|uniref:Exonuclease domain-containing protein n=1 Tax=Clostridium aestuarii TaxID=338193 RepID=A0ABT4CXV5_9CLOT|nr:3'-5' exonuclease [Clostridium aestuarii]MCY6483809.1 exonuclease domain-containing protein [Clostridium aestuarii]
MNYIIYDLEFNQKSSDIKEIKTNKNSNLPFEIIQIGALKLNENFETLSTFNALIKPTLYNTVHPYVERLTKITDDKIKSCKLFPDVYNDFIEFIGDDEIILCVWGTVDIKELLRNIRFHNLSTSLISKYYIDIQQYASKYLNAPKRTKIGLKNAVELLNISINNGEFHDAFNDAYYTTEVFKKIYDNNIKPKLYTHTPNKRVSQPKEKIDMDSLITQFEKMYNREMSDEEKSIIKTAYMMGRTKQFIL